MRTRLNTKSFLNYSTNLGIRGFTIGLKFLLTLFLGKYYPEEVLGEYGLFSTTVSFSFIALSLSFESYALRELLQKSRKDQPSYIRNLFIFFTISYLIFICLSLVTFNQVWKNNLILYFVIALFLETMCQVLFSLFTILQKPIAANLTLFFSQGSWIAIALLLWLVDHEILKSVKDFLGILIIGGAIASCYGFFMLRKNYNGFHFEPIDWKWIYRGISISLIFFCSALGYKIIEFADRYFLEFKLGTAQVGIYIFFSQIANLVNTVINVTVILMLYPKLIDSYLKGEIKEFQSVQKKMYQRVLVIGLVVSLVASIFINFGLTYIGKESFYEEVSVFYILLGANLAMNLSFIPNYCMYAMRKDLPLLLTTLIGSFSSLVLNFYLIGIYGLQGSAVATCASFVLIWILKSLYVKKYGILTQ